MKSIVFIIDSLTNGGSERVVSILANSLVGKGYKVSIILVNDPTISYKIDDNINVYNLVKVTNGNKGSRFIKRIKNLRSIIKTINSDVVISFDTYNNILSLIATRYLSTKIIISERNDPNSYPKEEIVRVLRTLWYNFADSIVFQTIDAKNYFNKNIQSKGHIILNPISDNLPKWIDNQHEKKVIAASRLNEQKNLKMLINSFKTIVDKYPEYKLYIYGDGPERKNLTNLVSKLNLQNSVYLPGFTDDIHHEMSKSEVFVIPSNYEGISNSMLEALAIGVPVIATDAPIGGARMLIESYKNGILIDVGDTTGLTFAIKEIISQPTLRTKLSKESILVRDRLSKEKIVQEWVDIIEFENI